MEIGNKTITIITRNEFEREPGALSTFDFKVAKLVESFGLSGNRRKS